MEYWSEVGKQLTKQTSDLVDPTGISKDLVDGVVRTFEDYQARYIRILLQKEVPSQVDGEQYKTAKEFTIKCVENALTLMVPNPY